MPGRPRRFLASPRRPPGARGVASPRASAPGRAPRPRHGPAPSPPGCVGVAPAGTGGARFELSRPWLLGVGHRLSAAAAAARGRGFSSSRQEAGPGPAPFPGWDLGLERPWEAPAEALCVPSRPAPSGARGSLRQAGAGLCRGARGLCQAEGLWHRNKYRKPKLLKLHTHRRIKKGWASCPGVELLALAGGWGEPVRGSVGVCGVCSGCAGPRWCVQGHPLPGEMLGSALLRLEPCFLCTSELMLGLSVICGRFGKRTPEPGVLQEGCLQHLTPSEQLGEETSTASGSAGTWGSLNHCV